MTDATEHMTYLSFLVTLLCSFIMVEVLMLFLGELLLLLAWDHILLRPLQDCLDIINHTLTRGQLMMFLNLLYLQGIVKRSPVMTRTNSYEAPGQTKGGRCSILM